MARQVPRDRIVIRLVRCRLTLIIALALGLSVPAEVAFAQRLRCEAPPGTAAIDQYCESVPAGGGGPGNRRSGDAPDKTEAAPTVSDSALQALRANGKGGQDLAEALRSSDRTAPRSDVPPPSRRPATPPVRSDAGKAGLGALTAVRTAVENGTTMGGRLIWLLIAIMLTAVVVGWFRFRRVITSADGGREPEG